MTLSLSREPLVPKGLTPRKSVPSVPLRKAAEQIGSIRPARAFRLFRVEHFSDRFGIV